MSVQVLRERRMSKGDDKGNENVYIEDDHKLAMPRSFPPKTQKSNFYLHNSQKSSTFACETEHSVLYVLSCMPLQKGTCGILIDKSVY